MSNFVKLPSGRGVNTDNISSWNNIIQSKDIVTKEPEEALLILFTDEADGATWFHGPDARALYAYLDSQAVVIGEDGKAVTPEAEPVELTPEQRKFMNYTLVHPSTGYTAAKKYSGINVQGIAELRDAGLIHQEHAGDAGISYTVTDNGRRAIGKATK